MSHRVGISTRDSASLVPERNSDPSGKISLSYIDTHDELLYSQNYHNFHYPRITRAIKKFIEGGIYFSIIFQYAVKRIIYAMSKFRSLMIINLVHFNSHI